MVQGFFQKGIASVVSLIGLAVLTVVVIAGVYLVGKNTGFFNFASWTNTVTVTGILVKSDGCLGNHFGSSSDCYALTKTSDGKDYQLRAIGIDLSKFVGKSVKVTGQYTTSDNYGRFFLVKTIEEINAGMPKGQKLGLKVVPTLVFTTGCVRCAKLQVSWSPASGLKVDHYEVAVLDSSGKVIPGQENNNISGSNFEFNLSSVQNSEYTVRLRAIYSDKTIRTENAKVGYYERNGSALFTSLSNNSDIWWRFFTNLRLESGFGTVWINNGVQFYLKSEGKDAVVRELSNPILVGDFDVSTGTSAFGGDGTNTGYQEFSIEADDDGVSPVVRLLGNETNSVVYINRYFKTGERGLWTATRKNGQWQVSQSKGVLTPADSIKLRITRSGSTLSTYYDLDLGQGWNLLQEFSDAFSSKARILIGVGSWEQHPNVYGNFDSFRLVWVK